MKFLITVIICLAPFLPLHGQIAAPTPSAASIQHLCYNAGWQGPGKNDTTLVVSYNADQPNPSTTVDVAVPILYAKVVLQFSAYACLPNGTVKPVTTSSLTRWRLTDSTTARITKTGQVTFWGPQRSFQVVADWPIR